MKITRVSINKESFIKSAVKDTYSLSTLGGLCYFNYHFIGDSHFVNCFILFVILIMLSKNRSDDFSFYKVDDSKIEAILEIINNKKDVK